MKRSKIKEYKKKGLLEESFLWNDGYYLEGMDRLHTIQVMIEKLLSYHPAIILSGNQNSIDKVQKLLNDIYQSIGNMEYEDGEEK